VEKKSKMLAWQNTNKFYVIKRARDTLHDWKSAKTQQSSNKQDATVTVALGWQKSAAETFKCNIDRECVLCRSMSSQRARTFCERVFEIIYGVPKIAEVEAWVCEKLFVGWILWI
jgi:hypothetical protein